MSANSRGMYFSFISVLLLILSIVAFSDNLFTDINQPSNSSPKFIIHGLFGLAWYVLLVTQANLIRVRNVALHKKFGVATFFVAIGVILSTLYIFIAVWKGWSNMTEAVKANRILLVGFGFCILFAWRMRARSDWHKRFIFVGTFFMLGPILSRAYDPLIYSWMKFLFAPSYLKAADELAYLIFWWSSWIGFFLSLVLYDLKKLRRVHQVTMLGISWFVLTWLICLLT